MHAPNLPNIVEFRGFDSSIILLMLDIYGCRVYTDVGIYKCYNNMNYNIYTYIYIYIYVCMYIYVYI